MDWTAAIDGYCERLGPGFWAEPVNAVTNLAFIIGALWVWPRTDGLGRVLTAILFAIGVGSFLFHTYAQPWAALADVMPIVLYVLVYVYAANRDFWGLPVWASLGLTALFIPYAAALGTLFGQVPGLGGSAAYAPVPVMILVYAALLWRRNAALARGLAIGAAILILSLVLRTLDEPLCGVIPIGTHLWWHILNAVMLTWMIVVWTRHRLAGRAHGG